MIRTDRPRNPDSSCRGGKAPGGDGREATGPHPQCGGLLLYEGDPPTLGQGPASARAKDANNGVVVDYVIPKEGALVFYDMLAIPADAKHVANAHAFINYLMKPDVIAKVSNYVSYASGNKASLPMVNAAIRDNPNIYPKDEMKPKMFTLKVLPQKVNREVTRVWTKVKTGK